MWLIISVFIRPVCFRILPVCVCVFVGSMGGGGCRCTFLSVFVWFTHSTGLRRGQDEHISPAVRPWCVDIPDICRGDWATDTTGLTSLHHAVIWVYCNLSSQVYNYDGQFHIWQTILAIKSAKPARFPHKVIEKVQQLLAMTFPLEPDLRPSSLWSANWERVRRA